MIKRFLSTETVFNHNKYVLNPRRVEVKEEANGLFEIEVELPKNTIINKRDIITAPTPRGEQPFRVYRITKTLNGKKVFARHIFYDLTNAFLLDTRPTNTNVNGALQSILTTVGWTGWSYLSDITELRTAYYIRKNPVEAIIGAENSILNTWGGNLVRNGKEIRILASGIDRGYEIRLGKNLLGIEDDSDDTNVITRLYPTYEKDKIIYGIPEKYVDSPLIGSYPTPIEKEVRVALTDDQKGYTDEQIYQVLRDHCNNLFSVDNIDKPIVNYKVDFVELSKISNASTMGQFTDLLEKIDLYDEVSINIDELDINLKARVIKYSYDAIAEKYLKIELGGFKSSNQYQVNNLVQQLKNDRDKASDEFRELYDLAINKVTGNKGGYKIERLNADKEPYETLWMDTPDISTAQKVLRINKEGIAGSATGFNGPYGVAITTDGWIVAERIQAISLSAISANLGEVTTGKLRSTDGTLEIDLSNKTIKIGSGAESVHTDLQYNGMLIKDGERLVAAFGESGAIIPIAEIGEIKSNDVIQPIGTGFYTVGVGKTFTSLTEAFNAIFPNGKKYINGTVTIEVHGIVIDNPELSYLTGGALYIKFMNGAKLIGNMYFGHSSNAITVYGSGANGIIASSSSYGIEARACLNLRIGWMAITGTDASIHAADGSKVYISDTDTATSPYYGILAEVGSYVLTAQNRGSNTVSLETRTGSIIFTTGGVGQGARNGHIISNTLSESASTYEIPPVTAQTSTAVFGPTSMYTVNHDTVSVDSYYGAAAAQGKYSGMSYWKDGIMTFGPDIYNYWQGGYNVLVEMRVRRKNSSHGSSAGVVPTAYNFTPSEAFNAIGQGVWSEWTTVPAAVFGSGGATLKFYNGNLNSGYAILDAAEVRVTVTKDV